MTTTIDINIAADICSDIIEDGKKLRSLDQLMEKYQLSFPFKAKHRIYGVVEIEGHWELNKEHINICCMVAYINVLERAYTSTPCAACVSGEGGLGAWSSVTENWILA